MFGFTQEQRKLYDRLQNAIKDHGNVAEILQGVSKDDLLAVLITYGTTIESKNGNRETLNLLAYAYVIENQEGVKAIFNAIREKGISLKKEIVDAGKHIIMDSPNVVKFDGTPFDNKQTKPVSFNALKENVMLRELFVEMIKENGEFFNSNFSEKSVADMDKDDREEMKAVFKETGNNDLLDRVLQVEASMAVSKAMKVGVVCGVIAALVVGGGCFAAGAQLSILAIAGIAVAARWQSGLLLVALHMQY